MDYDKIIKKLKEPFTKDENEWKIQTVLKDKPKGLAVAYINSRALQKRLDEVAGAFNWKNEYIMWQEKSQVCGISIYHEERGEWITKYDGAENTDYEPIKGGLTDSFKRAAILWGIGRYLYSLTGIWVDVEQRGKGHAIKQSEYAKLEAEYSKAISKLFGTEVEAGTKPLPKSSDAQTDNKDDVSNEFTVKSLKPSGKSSLLLQLLSSEGELINAYVKNDERIAIGACLRNVDITEKTGSYGPYSLINKYEVVQPLNKAA